ncbi:hypothetical protein [Klebsiella pneumoniae]|uniref:hypothetical protein n=1 Tax=Klebsiella pneumoniae TaxID=573 RepID=UPI0002C416FF|nr:hypothetical protein [Klebsiella pneumoniae]APR45495.1 hypothetical protein AM428_01790 [Klebsiella pneumoniae]EMR16507.1 hypothetical protein G000_24680 [Klebsiella pneumoniae ATCC BAA-2146]HBY8325153.1 hypothetical protein [Klebsiella pneumoniae]
MERLIVMLDEIDLLPFFTLTVFISAIHFTEIYRLITECRKINKFISCRSRGNYFVDFALLRAVNFSVYSLFPGIIPRLLFSKKTPDKSG